MTHIIKKQHVKLETEIRAREQEGQVELLQEENVVRAIQVRCSCGKTTVVELEYDETRSPAPDPR